MNGIDGSINYSVLISSTIANTENAVAKLWHDDVYVFFTDLNRNNIDYVGFFKIPKTLSYESTNLEYFKYYQSCNELGFSQTYEIGILGCYGSNSNN